MPRKGTRLITVPVELADRSASVGIMYLPHAYASNWMAARFRSAKVAYDIYQLQTSRQPAGSVHTVWPSIPR